MSSAGHFNECTTSSSAANWAFSSKYSRLPQFPDGARIAVRRADRSPSGTLGSVRTALRSARSAFRTRYSRTVFTAPQ
ncbi:hypothetical protein pZL12.92 [Streptomyces phage ZL12]|uniref:Uncharacterized protein n=1 Tax=Streptomyces phage ZL12 TaxID=2570911 RepID=D0UWJ7_9CAUD|nr:hypothetical protein QEH43_gp092 [Streptomyces phage ZL12]ACX71169.1 hypothetical protein pZL12.92 [Streptomyces phage ZL12]